MRIVNQIFRCPLTECRIHRLMANALISLHMRRLIRAFAVRVWHNDPFPMMRLYLPINKLLWNKRAATWEIESSDMYIQKRRKSANAPAQSDQSLRFPPEESLHPMLSKMRPAKIQIRLRICAGWSESLLGAHIQRYVFCRCGSILSCVIIGDSQFQLLYLEIE